MLTHGILSQMQYAAPAAAPAGFDPTAGGALDPYWWYDFTDDSTMTLVSTNEITSIQSKGSSADSLANTYATSNPTWEGDYTQFTGGTSTNNKMNIDVNFPMNRLTDSWTLMLIGNFSWPTGGGWNFNHRYASYIDSNTTITAACQWDIFPGLSSFGGTQKNIDTCTAASPSGTPSIYGGFYSGVDNYNYKVYNGLTETGYTAITYRYNHSTLVSELGQALDSSNMCTMANTMQTYTVATGMGFTIGGRAYTNILNGAIMKLAHVLFYPSNITNGDIDTVLGSYTPPA
jgi:hypothetical protein